ncbi:helicase-exonuclease AddAB subunit AddB [Paenibacillus sp. P96]|uniref:ATP-dependent helicase/deoxyribonuclease subunit B n=1 Tax=Paenibacillus zeirhizosphaerae TaxID=2987519 RepID=A0ABT9FQK7_9BACL|nr:helicase-exonuclease AddAB subunit AddB [Paenibacillus sp. P96]MDP4096996.1 helicase-exonuclease AddAB subunit AddB [Paenibacillus sp. P96]
MSLRFLIGRSGSGKTTRIHQEIIGKLKEQPQGRPLILLVPEQATFHTEHALLSSAEIKGTVRAQVLGFRRLAYRIMQETGGTALTPVTEEGKKMLLYKIVRRRREELQVFRDSGDQLGFVDRLNALFTEFKRYGENPASLPEQLERIQAEQGSPILNSKIQDILTLYRDFEQELAPLYLDGEDTMMRLASQLPHSSWLDGADVWLDGYRGFTPQEYKVIEQLLLSSSSLTVSLTLNREYEAEQLPHELDLFHPTASVYVKLKGIARELGVDVRTDVLQPEILPRFASSPELAHLEAGFGQRRVWASLEPPAGIELHAAADRRAEVEGAIREMRRLAREEGVRYRDMAVFVRNPADYEHLLEPLFTKYEVPLFIDQKRDILHHPLVEFVRAALDIVRRHWRYEDVFRAVKTDLLLPSDGHVTRDCMDELENYALACGIQGSRWTDGRPWRAVPNLSLEMNETERVKARDETLERMERCRAVVVAPLYAFAKRLSKAKTAREQCEAVYRLLEDADIGRKLDRMILHSEKHGEPERAREHSQIWDAVLELLDQMNEMVGEEKLPVELFAGMLETGLAEYRLALIPPALDQVLVGSVDRTRVSGIQYAFLLGVNEGVMPAVPQEEGVLSEQERSRLAEQGIALAPDVTRRLLDERFLAYTAMTSAGRKLWVSYPVADEEGKPLLPSEYIRHLRLMFKGLKEKPLTSQPLPGADWTAQSEYALHAPTALSQLVVQLRQWLRGADIAEPWWEVYNWYAGSSGGEYVKLKRLLTSLFYENRAEPLQRETSRSLYGTRLRTSVSRMERFVACPFSHFASHGLKLKERQTYKLKAPDIGQLFHAALGSMALHLKESNRSWGSLSPEQCRQEAEATVDRLAPRLQGEILLSSKRYGYIFRKLKDIVSRASLILGEHARRGSFEPLGLELDFGPGKEIPPLTFELENGVVMEVIGRIDRVDVAEGEEGLLLRVIDYKSSHKDLKLHEVYYGLALQMLTYLDVLLTSAEEWLGEPAYPAGTLYFHVHNPLLQSANGMSPEQAQQELLKKFKMKGLLLADRDVITKMDVELDKGHSAILPVAVKADGGFYSSAAVASPQQWQSLLSAVRSNIRTIGTRMTEGEVDIVPYRIQQETACDFCSYRSVCQFDDSLDGSKFKHLSKPGKEQLWNMLDNHEGGGTE